jgi:phosphatidylserine/phosphatidylglycerophosphate/cardiolipin synthase-like enzyme
MSRTLLSLKAVIFAAFLAAPAMAADITPCFTPGEDCTSQIVREIDGAKKELLVQAYSFTSAPIIAAIARAHARGVKVSVILDKSNVKGRYSGATYLKNHGITPLIDRRVAIAHNKVMVIDGRDVISGSFNFTKAAQEKNAENVLFIRNDPALARAYSDNWKKRASVSDTLDRMIGELPFGSGPGRDDD